MRTAVVVGAGVGGLGTALTLADAGHEVVVVERDDTSLPDTPEEAFSGWPRRGAPQVHHSHAFLARLRNLLRDHHPQVLADLLAAGATELRFTEMLPDTMQDRAPRAGDDDLVALACRRTTFEWVLRRAVAAHHHIELRQGAVTGLVADANVDGSVGDNVGRRPRVTGIRLDNGPPMSSDVVVDASGRRSPLPEWVAALGAPPLEETAEDTGIVYSSRFFRLHAGADPPEAVGPSAGDLGYLKFAVFLGDNRTYSITFGVPSDDGALRKLLHETGFTMAARHIPAVAPWADPDIAEPITGVEVMARLLNRTRTFLVDGQPVATGLFAVGDAHTCTNPLYGRGCSLAFVSAQLLAEALTDHPHDEIAAALAYEAAMEREVDPWYRAAVTQDREERRAREAPALSSPTLSSPASSAPTSSSGSPPAAADPAAGIDMRALIRDGLLPATRTDPVVFRAFLRAFNLLDAPETLLRDPDLIGRVLTVFQSKDERPAAEVIGPDRAELLALLPD